MFSNSVKPPNITDLKGPSIVVLHCQNLILPTEKTKEKNVEGMRKKFAIVGISTFLDALMRGLTVHFFYKITVFSGSLDCS